jgi:RNA polymerase sigma factor (sigma-70 family)
VLGDLHGAEDAFQATFLVLARKAASIHKQSSLAAWLHRVAVNVARSASASAAQQRAHEKQAVLMAQATRAPEGELCDWQPLLHEEVDRLPQKYRIPIILCYFKGMTHDAAARQLDWPVGTVKGRLARARTLLRSRLARRGLALPSTAFAALLAESAASGAVSPALLGLTLRAALSFAAGGATAGGIVSAHAVILAKGALETMTGKTLLHLAMMLVAVALVGVGVALVTGSGPEAGSNTPAGQTQELAMEAAAQPIQLNLASVRPEYRIGEPVDLTLTIKNNSKEKIAFLADLTLASDLDGIPVVYKVTHSFHFDMTGSDGKNVKPIRNPVEIGYTPRLVTVLPGETATVKESFRSINLATAPGTDRYLREKHYPMDSPGIYRLRVKVGEATSNELKVKILAKEPPKDATEEPRLKLSVFGPPTALAIGDEIKLEVALSSEGDRTYQFQLGSFPQDFGIYLHGPGGAIQPDTNKILPQNWMHQQHGPAALISVSKGKPYRTTVKLSDYFPTGDAAQFKPGTYRVNVKFYDVGLKMPGPIDSGPVRFELVPKTPAENREEQEARKRLEDATKEDLKKLEGTWHMVGCEEGGKVFAPEDVNPHDYLTFSGTTFYFKSGLRGLKGTFTIDPSKNPRWMDQIVASAKLVFKGIYEFKGDKLRVFLGAPGGERPTQFKTKAGEKLWLRTFERLKAGQAGHAREVYSVALSPDGKQLISGSGDAKAIVWETATARQLQTLPGHRHWVFSVAFAADGHKVVTGSHDTTAAIWDVATGNAIQTFEGHTAEVSSVAISTDSKLVLTGSWDRTAILWDAATGTKRQTFKGHDGIVTSVALSTDGMRVVTGSIDKTAILWNAATAQKLKTFQGHASGVYCLALSADGKHLVTGSEDHTAILWDVSTGGQLQAFKGHAAYVQSVALSQDGLQVLTGSRDKTAILWDSATGKKLKTFEGHTDEVSSVAFAAGGKQVVTGSYDKTVILWDAATGKKLRTFPAPAAQKEGESRIDRTITREPAYQSKPAYCLLVFGPQARTRVWLVRDGDRLYVDRNGNGDLTDQGERHIGVKNQEGIKWQIGDIVEADGRTRHTDLRVLMKSGPTSYWKGAFTLALRTANGIHQEVGNEFGPLRFADRAEDAPIVHLAGPLTFLLAKSTERPFHLIPGQELHFIALVGTEGQGDGTTAYCHSKDFGKFKMAGEVEFPRQAPAAGLRVHCTCNDY